MVTTPISNCEPLGSRISARHRSIFPVDGEETRYSPEYRIRRRAPWKVGTQSISPLFWAIQYGALNSARAMMLGSKGWWWVWDVPLKDGRVFFGDVGEFLGGWKSDFF